MTRIDDRLDTIEARLAAVEARHVCACEKCAYAAASAELSARRAKVDEILANATTDADLLVALSPGDHRLRTDLLAALPRDRAVAFGVALCDEDLAILKPAFDLFVLAEIELRRAPRERHIEVSSVDPRLDWQRDRVIIPPDKWMGGLRHELAGLATPIDGDQRGVFYPLSFTPAQPRRVITARAFDAMRRCDDEFRRALEGNVLVSRELTDAENLALARASARMQGATTR